MTTKRCFKCLCEKPLSEFYAHAKMKDGRLNKCKECTKTDALNHRLENLDRIRAYDRMRASIPHRAAARSSYLKHYRADYPDRDKARRIVSNAIRDGKLQRQPCWICGKKAQAHHPDYSMPLMVSWLCPVHHAEAHAIERNSR